MVRRTGKHPSNEQNFCWHTHSLSTLSSRSFWKMRPSEPVRATGTPPVLARRDVARGAEAGQRLPLEVGMAKAGPWGHVSGDGSLRPQSAHPSGLKVAPSRAKLEQWSSGTQNFSSMPEHAQCLTTQDWDPELTENLHKSLRKRQTNQCSNGLRSCFTIEWGMVCRRRPRRPNPTPAPCLCLAPAQFVL